MTNKTLNNAFPIVAAALGNKLGVRVSVGGNIAMTNGKHINVPAYNGQDPDYLSVAWGYLAHESGHVRFTDFSVYTGGATNPIRHSIVNHIEDVRIEKAMMEVFPGTRLTLRKLDEYLCSSNKFSVPTESSHPSAILGSFLSLRLAVDVLGFTSLEIYADAVEAVLESVFPTGAVTRLFGLLSEVPSLDSTQSVVYLVDKILSMLQEEKEKAEDQARQQKQDQDQSPDDDADDGNSLPDVDSNDPDQDQNDDSGADDDTNDQVSDNNLPDVNSSDPDQEAATLASVLGAMQDDLCQNFQGIAQQILAGQAEESYDNDVSLPLAIDPVRNDVLGQQLLKKALLESGPIRASLLGLIQSQQQDRTTHKRMGNRIDGRRVTRLLQGDARVFTQHAYRQAQNTAVDIIVDASPSMNITSVSVNARRIDIAMEAAIALALALENIDGVNPAVTSFPHQDNVSVTPLLRHGERVRNAAASFNTITHANTSTPLHTALWYAAASVMETVEKRKVILVLTDGEPDDSQLTKAVINRCKTSGIEMIGVGIGIDIQHLFEKSIFIDDVSGLRSELFRISRELFAA